jgi:hypothetical protein
MLRRTSRAALSLFGVALVLGCTAATSLAATEAPAWKIVVGSNPTDFAPGAIPIGYTATARFPQYTVTATNVGAASTIAGAILTDTLPEGIVPAEAVGQNNVFGAEDFECEIAGQTVTCTVPGPTQSGRHVEVAIPVEVSPTASGTLQNSVEIGGGGAARASASTTTTIADSSAPFGLILGQAGFSAALTGVDGLPATLAGSHPGQLTIDSGFPTTTAYEGELLTASGHLRDLQVTLPRGLVVNPTATPRCTASELESFQCPASSAVGLVVTGLSVGPIEPNVAPLYNMIPAPGVAADFAFDPLGYGFPVHIFGGVNTAGEYELHAGVTNILAREANPIIGAQTVLWGDPSAVSHADIRGGCFNYDPGVTCPVEPTDKPFVTMPSACSSTFAFGATVDSWEEPSEVLSRTVQAEGTEGEPTGVEGCSQLDFSPGIESHPTADATDSPTGLDVTIRVPQDEHVEGRAEANMKDATVDLPVGLAVNPSSAGGLGSCTESQFDQHSVTPVGCPDSSKIGSAQIHTQLLEHPVPGALYLAKPFDNPFHSLLALYLVFEDPVSGVIIKLSGKVEADQPTSRLTTSFADSPELPFESISVHLFEGARAPLTTPLGCGEYTTTSDLTPWSAPEGADDAHPTSAFETQVSASGSGTCPKGEAEAPKTVSFTAGTESPLSGSYSPFVLRLARPDGSQHITGIETTLPEGLLGKLAGVSYCPEAGIAQAVSREVSEKGTEEQASPSCPASSEVGTVQVTAGSGSSPIPVSGHAYLAGPYKGAQLSLVVIVPAVAGPFDLGDVVTRVALNVDPFTAQIHAVSDPLPTIRDGIPIDVRSIELKLDRSGFTLNPTSCEAMAIEGSITTQAGQTAPLNNRFQVGGCNQLKFKPQLKLSLTGSTKRVGHPGLKAVLTYPKQGAYANIARAQVNLPHSEFIDQGNLNKTCTRPVLLDSKCPKTSIYGRARAWTPLLEKPLEGPVYLVGGFGYKLPALVAELNGQIRVLLVGKVDSGANKGIRNTFEAVPDAPVSRFVLELKGGPKYSLLENSEDLCRRPQRAAARFVAQNGKVEEMRPRIANSCKGKGHRQRHKLR